MRSEPIAADMLPHAPGAVIYAISERVLVRA
jgi:hypothetical protein